MAPQSKPPSPLLALLLYSLLVYPAVPSDPCSSGNRDKCSESGLCGSRKCPPGSSCRSNGSDSYCYCKTGFRLCMGSCTTGRPYCKDVDECLNSRKCGRKENCLNTIGGYCCLAAGTHINCTDCERACYSNKTSNATSSTASDKMCISACEIQELYQTVTMVNSRSVQLGSVDQLLDKAESMMMSLVEAPVNQLEERQSMEAFEIGIKRQITVSEPLILSVMGYTVEVDAAVLSGMRPGQTAAAALIVHKELDTFLHNSSRAGPGHQGAVLSSRVITMVIGNRKNSTLSHPLTFTFLHNKTNKDSFYITCVYWSHSRAGSWWSTEGCDLAGYNATHTVCKASHLSSFAILMALKELPAVFEVEIITYVGLSASLLCLLLAITTFYICPSLKDTRCCIHRHLCLCLFMADFIFLLGISQTGNAVLCAVIAATLHYLFLAVFMWMFLEGVQLYLLVEVVFATKVPFERHIYWIGYGLPAAIVATCAGIHVHGYGTPTACWLSTQHYFTCSFFVPAIFICVVNLIILCRTLMKLSHVISDQPKLNKNRVFTLTALGQLVILGSTWIFGGLFIENATVPMMYIFSILNSFQGMFIFVMHCLMRKKVREWYQRGFTKCFTKCFARPVRWTPVAASTTSSNQVRRSVQETESTSGEPQ